MKEVPRTGPHTNMSPDGIDKWYLLLKEEYQTYLKQYGIKFPAKNSNKALQLIFLRKNKGALVHKDTISIFVQSVIPHAGKDQQVRHLGREGWNILNKGDKLPDEDKTVPSGYHVLLTTESPKPSFLFAALKRAGRVAAKDFEQLKIAYDNRCVTCGSQEGKPHFLQPSKRTELHQGHMNPHKELTLDNSIPQCQVCNGIYKDYFVFDAKGRTIAVASTEPVLKAEKFVQERIKKALEK